MLSSDTQPGDSSRRLEVGLSGYAEKPVPRAQLLRLICDATAVRSHAGLHPGGSVGGNETGPVRPARILVAEDSPDNRLLVQVYLKGSPYNVTFEEDGKAAVDRLATSDFDLILMDVRMPVMDGLTATRAIRALERERGTAPIPIIALTANASSQDIESSRDAGCDTHLSKPISKFELLTAIEKYRRQPTPEETAQSGHLEPIRIEMPQGLEDIVPGYLANRRNEVSEMIELLAASDFKRLSVLGHNLKGTARGYGFPDLAPMGSALELSASYRDSGALHTQITDLCRYLDDVELIAK
jgi:CheY-like chemotaxis protein/HPt (histidine-containing phosphotransfer) domain-containing protein